MTNIQPIQTTQVLRDTYTRYLRSLNIMNDEQLNVLYRHALDHEDILKGPYIEGTLPFVAGGTIQDLINDRLLSPQFARLNQAELPLTRPVYLHQAEAIRKIIREQRNIIVATGTGSGKTESFLLPLLQMLFAESATERAQPGVRALLLYPMNALANDQLKRLRQLLAHTPEISFGRYTGETAKTEREALETYIRENGINPLPNERISRESMRNSPPDILLTNYAMLEYLLLRPEDNMFFDGAYADYWKYVVLDEIHTYDGAKGVEISMLIRRLKQRIRVKPGQLRCVGTSATIGSESELAKVAQFATQLFDEPFVWDGQHQDIVRGQRAVLSGDTWGTGNTALYDALHHGLTLALADTPSTSPEFASALQRIRAHLPPAIPTQLLNTVTSETYGAFLYAVLSGDQRTHHAQQTLLARAQSIYEFADAVQLTSGDDVVAYIELLLHAKRSAAEKPLLPSRYHLFAKSLEGMFICLNKQGHPTNNYQVSLHRFATCPICQQQAYELARCAGCGAPYVTGVLNNNRIQQPEYNDVAKAVPYALHLDDTPFSQLGNAIAAQSDNVQILHYALCTSCGLVRGDDTVPCPCGSTHTTFVSARQYPQARGQMTEDVNTMNSCVMCGYLSPQGRVIQTFDTGQDAPVGMLTSALYQQIPERSAMRDTIGGGRRLIVFSDSRQDAAFFAPYLERNHAQVLQRRIILEQINQLNKLYPNEVRIEDAKIPVRRAATNVFLFDDNQSSNTRDRLVLTWLMRDVIRASRDNTTLESQGLLHVRMVRPARFVAPQSLARLGLSDDESWLVIQFLLDTIRRDRAVTFPNDVVTHAPEFQPGPKVAQYVRKVQTADNIDAWLPARHNQRSKFLARLIKHVQPQLSVDASKQLSLQVLDALWDELTRPGNPLADMWSVTRNRNTGDVYQLKYERIEFTPYARPSGFVCTTCRQHTFINIRGLCVNVRCKGQLVAYAPDRAEWTISQQNYLMVDPIGMVVKEHSGNLKPEQARAIQIDFTEGKVNTLSCTTTFELGVDVGELQTVMMRNMPPTSANYIQRAGRAGRRDGAAALILTYAQRRPHDLNYFVDPIQMISGVIPAPRIQADNEKIVRRHLHAVVLAAFLREWFDTRQIILKRSGEFFERTDQQINPAVQGLIEFVGRRQSELQTALHEVIDTTLHDVFGIADWGWVGAFEESESDLYLNSLYKAETILNKEFDELKAMHALILTELQQGSGNASHLVGIEKILKTLRERQLFGVLPNFTLMPKYGFPTDVVPLKTDHIPHDKAKHVSLERDLRIAIGEYAPGSQIVAAGVVWESGGVVIPRGRGLIAGSYYQCPKCEFMTRSLGGNPIQQCGNCFAPVVDPLRVKQYIIPEFGFIAHIDKTADQSFTARPARSRASRLYFSDMRQNAPAAQFTFDPLMAKGVTVNFMRNSMLSAINEGPSDRGFVYCERCGYAMIAPTRIGGKTAHKSPTSGRECSGQMSHRVRLMHNFVTDVVELDITTAQSATLMQWRSVLYAVMEGAARHLQIERDEIDGTVYWAADGNVRLVIFDTVPGGAGFARQIAEQMAAVLRAGLAHVKIECCGADTSCYRCLRNYGNQFYHNDLRRGDALAILLQLGSV